MTDQDTIAALRQQIETLTDHLASLTAAQERMTWQPIKSAPKDSDTVIVYDPAYVYANGLPASWDRDSKSEGGQCWRTADPIADRLQPTHWMPLPPPPLAASSRETKDATTDQEKGQPPPMSQQQKRCKAEEWYRDGRGIWAMRACSARENHGGPHVFLGWTWNVQPPAAEASAVSPEGAQEEQRQGQELAQQGQRDPSCDKHNRKLVHSWVCPSCAEKGAKEILVLRNELSALKSAASLSPSPTTSEPTRTKGIYIGAPACFALEEAIRPVCEAFNCYQGKGIRGCYVVGSALQRPDWRDVDVRLMLDDDSFAEVFPDAGQHWEHDARWLCLTVAISERLSRLTGLPIDFQFQPMTHANERHKGRRNAIGLRITSEPSVGAQGDGTERPAGSSERTTP